MWTLTLNKEKFKFAASHFAIFGPYCGERLHGHNYYVQIKFKANSLDPKVGMAIEFNEIKPQIYKELQLLDEYVLLPTLSPHLAISEVGDNIQVVFNSKTYSLPKVDIKSLEITNVSCEELSLYLWKRLGPLFTPYNNIVELTVSVQETRGQSASYTRSLK